MYHLITPNSSPARAVFTQASSQCPAGPPDRPKARRVSLRDSHDNDPLAAARRKSWPSIYRAGSGPASDRGVNPQGIVGNWGLSGILPSR